MPNKKEKTKEYLNPVKGQSVCVMRKENDNQLSQRDDSLLPLISF